MLSLLFLPYLAAIYQKMLQGSTKLLLPLIGDSFLFEDALGRRKLLPCDSFQYWKVCSPYKIFNIKGRYWQSEQYSRPSTNSYTQVSKSLRGSSTFRTSSLQSWTVTMGPLWMKIPGERLYNRKQGLWWQWLSNSPRIDIMMAIVSTLSVVAKFHYRQAIHKVFGMHSIPAHALL